MSPKSWVVGHLHDRLALATIFVGMLLMVGYILVQVWPYNDVEITVEGDILTQEYTSDGIPVIRASEFGADLRYSIDYCNSGVDVRTVRWLDSYGPFDTVTDIKNDLDDFSSSRFLSETLYPATEGGTGCFEDLEVVVTIGNGPPTDVYYRLSTTTYYYPNFLAKVELNSSLELFYYASEGADIP